MLDRFLTAFSACCLLAAPALAQGMRYEAVWHQGQATSFSSAPLSLSNFRETGDELVQSGLRLIDVETEILNGRRVYAGLWVKGEGSNVFDGPMGPIPFRDRMNELRERGLRLVDFEIFRRDNGGRLYLGVWRNGSGSETLTGPMQEDAFFARGERLVAQGLRLIDVEVERIDGVLLYSGLFQTGTGSNLLTAPMFLPAFRAKRDEMVAQGLELVDMERIERAGRDRFVGVWASGQGESRISKLREFGPFLIFSQDQFNDEKHAVDLELLAPPQTGGGGAAPGGGGSGGGGSPRADVNDLPPNPQWIEFSGSTRLFVDFATFIDGHPRITLPVDFLPDFLPLNGAGEIMIPDNLCGFNVIEAGSFNWQTQQNQVITDFPYNEVENVADLGSNDFLGGIEFTGPIGACHQDNEPWQFFTPLTQHGGDSPVPGMKLVIEMRQGSEIEFLNFNIHAGEGLDPLELFSDDVFETLENIAKTFEYLGEDNGYCANVSSIMVEICDANPGICPVSDPMAAC